MDAAATCLLRRLCRWFGADNAFWIGAIRVQKGASARHDAMSGWRAGAIHMLDSSRIDVRRQKEGLRALNAGEGPGATSRALAARAGRFRLFTLQSGELVDLTTFRKTSHYEWHYRKLGICDRMWAVFPVNADAEAYYCFDKHGTRRRFTMRHMALAAHALRGIKWFHRQLLLSHGLGVCKAALTPTERRALQELLSGKSERHVAERLGVTTGSAHQYATSVYRKFGARGRAEMMAMWLSRSI